MSLKGEGHSRNGVLCEIANESLVSVSVNFRVINFVSDLLNLLVKLISYSTRDLSLTPTM